ncbi:hypothetical protein M6B38_266455 [Iris pallida]|uniref:Uncharacterized protein n=1 Tax=Iris pallida TaxID=29817 RepID=A0AAX6I9S8_IRIPA|nr:hypothetical protein M6B38_266455 [Iris pallida]
MARTEESSSSSIRRCSVTAVFITTAIDVALCLQYLTSVHSQPTTTPASSTTVVTIVDLRRRRTAIDERIDNLLRVVSSSLLREHDEPQHSQLDQGFCVSNLRT